MTASSSPSLAFPKSRPKLLEKRAKAADLARVDKAESAKVKHARIN